MKIIRTDEIDAFFERCLMNMQNDAINDYVGVVIQSPEEEEEIKQELHDLNDPEFQGPKETWPSLYIDIEPYTRTPYNTNIHLDKISDHGFQFASETMPAHELLNMTFIQPDPNRELNDYMILRAFNKPYQATALRQNGEFWMTDNPAEANTTDPCVEKAHGNVLTFGLGIGYFVYMCLLKPEVKSVTVVELSESVINMFKKYILPQFPKDKEVHIIHGNAFDYFNKDFIDQFDYTFVDVWKNHEDGYGMIEKMLEQYLPPYEDVDFWIESTCFEFITSMICLYFNNISQGLKTPRNRQLQKQYKKIHAYFEKIDRTVDNVDELKNYMYDPKILREIVSVKTK